MLGVGLQAGGSLALALEARSGSIVESIAGLPATNLVVGAGAPERARLVAGALASGFRVLVDDPASLLKESVNLPLDRVFAALHFRFEPAAIAARASLKSGSVGLPFAVTAEAIAPACGSASLALDLLDAVLTVTGLGVEEAPTVSVDPRVISLLLSNGVVGDVTALAMTARDVEPLGVINVRGSGGSLSINLESPRVFVAGAENRVLRMGESGVDRMLDAFTSGAPLPTLGDAAALARGIGLAS